MAEADELGGPDPEPADPLVLVRQAARRAWPWLAGVVVVLAGLGGVFGARASWGDVGTWALAVTGLLALVAAVFAGLVAYAVLAVEMRRDQFAAADRRRAEQERAEQREADRRGQADRVAAWFGVWQRSDAPALVADGVVVMNASALPVYDMDVTFCLPQDLDRDGGWYQGAVGKLPERLVTVPPGEQVREKIPGDVRRVGEARAGSKPGWLIAIEFTDAAGARWHRDPRGRLAPGPVPSLPDAQ
jgi:hypothetical protein